MAAHQHNLDIAQEVALIQNAPGLPAIHQQQQLAVILNRLRDVVVLVDDIQASLNRIPMQLYNATASLNCALLYPPGIVPRPPLPRTKAELYSISAAGCNACFVHLGLPPVAAGVPITQRRQILMDYLGSATLAHG